MSNPSCLIDLKNTLPKTSWPQVILALRQDALIWQALQNSKFRGLAISKLGSHPENWTPAQLALLTLKIDLALEELRQRPLSEFDPELRVRAIQTYEDHSNATPPEMSLAAAGLLSLALQEHFRLTNSWEKIPLTKHWMLPFACLHGLIEKPIPLLTSLPIELAIHTILANPLTNEEQTKTFNSILVSAPNSKRLTLIRSLAFQRPGLANSIAQKLWQGSELDPKQDFEITNDFSEVLTTFEQIQRLSDTMKTSVSLAETQILYGDTAQSSASLKDAWQTTRQLQTILATQATKTAIISGNIKEFRSNWEVAQQPPEIPIEHTAELALSLLLKDQLTEAQPFLEILERKSQPAALLALAISAYQREDEKAAQEIALQALENLEELNAHQTFSLAKLLLALRLPTEAVYVTEIARKSLPHKIELLLIAARAYAATGAYPQAIQAYHLAIACEPDQVDLHREYAQIHEYAGQWPAALGARKNIIATQSDPTAADFCALAKCALKLDKFQQAQDACKAAIEIDPDNGLALAILGETLSQMGKIKEAKNQLEESIRTAPDQAPPWLAMASFQQRAGDLPEATKTLRQAVQAAPEAAEIHLSLGEDYLQAGSPSQALVSLRKANQLAQSYPLLESSYLQSQIAQPLAKTLFDLGHAEEALQTIHAIHPLPENRPAALHLQAQIYIFLGHPEKAIPLLAKALLANPTDSAISLDYAQAQLEAKNEPDKAISALLALLENDPENVEALAWLAEALKATGASSNTLEAYRKALGTRLKEDLYWHPKLSIGLAQTALELNQPETALAALQGSWQTTPQNLLKIKQTLAEAYFAANLKDKALRTAHKARNIEPHSLETLIWFGDFACKLQAFDEATIAISHAIEIEPTRADLRLQLGAIHQQVGKLHDARQTIRSIVELDQATPDELRLAAKQLISLNHLEDAALCLKIAVRRCQEDLQTNCPHLLVDLINVYLKLGMQMEALEATDEFIELAPEKAPELLGERAKILNQLGRTEEANEVLDQALSENPNSIPLHLAAAQIQYSTGDLSKALDHAQKALQALPKDIEESSNISALALAADIAEAGLQSQTAKNIMVFEQIKPGTASNLDYFCLRSELALKEDEEIDAAQALTEALKTAADNPRVLALQARLTARHGDAPNAQENLKKALTTWGENPNHEYSSPAGILGISEAALELHQWSSAIYLLKEAAEKFPQEPRTHLRLARGLVLRAEHQRLCETLRVIGHAPGGSALADFTYQLFEQAILAAAQKSEGFGNAKSQDQITHWRIRGQAVFQPSGEHARALAEITHTPQSRAALLAALRHSREKQRSKQTALEYFASASHHLAQKSGSPVDLLVQIALALSKQKPKIATTAAQSALDVSIRQKLPSQPIFYAVQAYVAEQKEDWETVQLALDNAISHWDDEARWHIWAAVTQVNLANPDMDTILEHYTRAIELEPKHGPHYLKLGKAQLELGDSKTAISNLEKAANLLPKQSEPRMALANAYRVTGDIAQIFHNAEYAVELDPKNIDPYLLLAKSALEINNPEKAIEFCEEALRLKSQHPDALIIKARALNMVGQSTEALQSFDQALESTPQSISLMLEHAQLTDQAAGSQSAIRELQELSNKYPDDPRVLASLAKALIKNDQTDPAIEAAQKALQSNQGVLDCVQESHLLETLGRMMRRNGQLDHAIHYLSEAIQCNPESVGAYLELGRVYQDRRQYPQALDVFQQAIALAPGDAHAYYQAGQTLKAAKDYAAAEEMLKMASKLAPDDLAIRRQLGGLVALNLVHNRKDKADIYVE